MVNALMMSQRDTDNAKRKLIFEETVRFLKPTTVDAIRVVAQANFEAWEASAKQSRPIVSAYAGRASIYCEESDGLRVASLLTILYGKKVAVLNFANAFVFGGGVRMGAGAQEENMFRRSDCYVCKKLHEMDAQDRYSPSHTKELNAENGMVFLDMRQDRVCIRDQEEETHTDLGYRFMRQCELFPFIEMRAAAKDLRQPQHAMTDAAFEIDCRRRIEAQFATLIANGVKCVVLGAFGCGAFRNNPSIVARVYMEAVVRYASHFDVIAFAIIKSHDNLDAFHRAARTSNIALNSLALDLQSNNLGCYIPKMHYGVRPGLPIASMSAIVQHQPPAGLPVGSFAKRAIGRVSLESLSGGVGGGQASAGVGGGQASAGPGATGSVACLWADGREFVGRVTEPMVYLSVLQRRVIARKTPSALDAFSTLLPCWVPAALVAQVFGYDPSGIQRAQASLGGKPYLWATEFENVHATWKFPEATIVVGHKTYTNSEEYFHSQKPDPFDINIWKDMRMAVMRMALRKKFMQSPTLMKLLQSTFPHPLLSLKNDPFWGFDPVKGGQNMLGILLVELRFEIMQEAGDQAWPPSN